jgi:hypothetical protein
LGDVVAQRLSHGKINENQKSPGSHPAYAAFLYFKKIGKDIGYF